MSENDGGLVTLGEENFRSSQIKDRLNSLNENGRDVARYFISFSDKVIKRLGDDGVFSLGNGMELMKFDKKSNESTRLNSKIRENTYMLLSEYVENYRLWVEDSEELGFMEMVKNITYQLSRLAKSSPKEIPVLFEGFESKDELKKIDGYYFSDKSIEVWQDEYEPIILFALGMSRNGEKIPSEWSDLVSEYKKSKSLVDEL